MQGVIDQSQKPETIIRFSVNWWQYMLLRGGVLRSLVNGLEDSLAITGRTLLLVFLVYCGAEAGALLVAPDMNFPLWLEMGMFILQLAGLEGSIPGLARQADVLREKKDHEGAEKLNKVMISARVMTVLSISEGALHALGVEGQWLKITSAILLVVRGFVITGFLIALARVETKAPRVVSKDEYASEQETEKVQGKQAQTIATLRHQIAEMEEKFSVVQSQQQGVQGVVQSVVQSNLPELVQSVVQQVVQQQTELLVQQMQGVVQSVVQSQVQEVFTELAQVVQSQVQGQLQTVVQMLENDENEPSVQTLVERMQEVSSTVSEMRTIITQVRTVNQVPALVEPVNSSRRGSSKVVETEPLRLVQSGAKKKESEPPIEPLTELLSEPPEIRVPRYIQQQIELGNRPSLNMIMTQCKVSKNTAIRYRRELLDIDGEPSTDEMEIVANS